MKLNNKVYDIMKWLVIIVLPAVGTLYAAIMGVTCYAPLYTNFTVVLEFIGGDSMANFVHACISGGIGFVVTLALIMILGVEGNKSRQS